MNIDEAVLPKALMFSDKFYLIPQVPQDEFFLIFYQQALLGSIRFVHAENSKNGDTGWEVNCVFEGNLMQLRHSHISNKSPSVSDLRRFQTQQTQLDATQFFAMQHDQEPQWADLPWALRRKKVWKADEVKRWLSDAAWDLMVDEAFLPLLAWMEDEWWYTFAKDIINESKLILPGRTSQKMDTITWAKTVAKHCLECPEEVPCEELGLTTDEEVRCLGRYLQEEIDRLQAS